MRKLLISLILVLITIPFLFPFFKAGYFASDDGEWAVIRQASMHREIRQGQIPVRWSGDLNFGYGYPLFLFSYPGPYYLGEILHLSGFGFVNTVKTLFILATVISIIGMYFFAREVWKSDVAGIIAALFYLAGPYRFVNVYVRGSLGEIIAFALFPCLCLCGLKLLATGKRRFLLTGSLLLAFLVITHNVMAFLFFPFFLYFLVVETFLRFVKFTGFIKAYIEEIKQRKNKFKKSEYTSFFTRHINLIVLMILTGIGLSATFWLPALTEISYTRLGQTPLTNIDAEFKATKGTILSPLDNHGALPETHYARYEAANEMRTIIMTIAVLVGIIALRKKDKSALPRTVLYAVPYIIALCLLIPLAAPIWKTVPLLKLVDFPWRLYGLLLFIGPLIISAAALIPKIRYLAVGAGLVMILVIFPLAHPQSYTSHTEEYYTTNPATTTSANEYLAKGMASPPQQAAKEKIKMTTQNTKQDVRYTLLKNTSTDKHIRYSAPETTDAVFAIMYFPGWQLYVDGKKQAITYTQNNGVMQTTLPSGTHTVRIVFERTPIRLVADLITLGTIAGIIVTLAIQHIKNKSFRVS